MKRNSASEASEASTVATAEQTPPFDPEAVLAELTLDEKASLTSGSDRWHTVAIDRLGVRSVAMADGPHGLRVTMGPSGRRGAGSDGVDSDGVDSDGVDSDGAGSDMEPEDDHGTFDDGDSYPATCFPTAGALASSWDPELLRRVGAALGDEARARHLSVVLGPGVNIKRSPLCGRNFEYFSEDPLLAGELAVGIIEGIQSRGVGACIKHFAANNQETERLRVDARVDERALREIYLPAFEAAVQQARPWMVMTSYNTLNGLPTCQHPWLLTEVLREEWGFDGLVVSDWGAVYDRVAAARAGCDLEMPPAARSVGRIAEAARDGRLDESVLDERALAVLRLAARGEHVLDLTGDAAEEVDVDAHHALAREAAAASAVLLTNADDLLPLAPETRVLVVGELARTPRFQGGGSSHVNPTRVDVIADELRTAFSSSRFEPGYRLDPANPAGPADGPSLVEAAAAAAREAEVVIAVLGLPEPDESEGHDRLHMRLPVAQLELLEALHAANPRIVTVLANGGSVIVDEVVAHSQAVLETWLSGQAAGGAVADLLTGAVNPSGRLAETIPHRIEDCPSFLSFPGDSLTVTYGEGVFVGYRGYDAGRRDVAFPFGHGLSYTSFDYSDLIVSQRGMPGRPAGTGDLEVSVEVTVTNVGERAGAEVVQLYVTDVEASVQRPPRELKAFERVQLQPGESRRVRLVLDERAFAFWSPRHGGWVVEAGEVQLAIGRDSRTPILTETVTIDAPEARLPLDTSSSAAEWLADSRGGPLLREAIARHGSTFLEEASPGSLGLPLSTLADALALRTLPVEILDEVTAGLDAGQAGQAGQAGRPGGAGA